MAHRRPPLNVSSEYYALFGSVRSAQPERRLMGAVLEQTLQMLVKNREVKGVKATRLRREATAWIMREDGAALFSFQNICETLGLDAKWLRAKVFAQEPSRIHAVRDGTRRSD